MRAQLWLWFIGMIVTDLPVALGRHSRHAAPHGVFTITPIPAIAPQALSVVVSAFGGFILVALRRAVLRGADPRASWRRAAELGPTGSAVAVHPAARVPAALNGLRAVARADDRPDGHQLRLSDRATCCARRRRRFPRSMWERNDERRAPVLAEESMVHGQRRRHGRRFSCVAALAGFVVLPCVQPNLDLQRHLGRDLQRGRRAARPRARRRSQPDFKVSTVVVTSAMLASPTGSIGRGATLAQQCAICHGPSGVSRRQFAQSRRPIRRRDLQRAE